MGTKVETRRVKESAEETLMFSAGAVLVVLVISAVATQPRDLHTFLSTASSAGGVLYEELGWILGIFISVLIGFYIVSIGGQIWGPRKEIRLVRRRLGMLAELLLASLSPMLAFVVAHCAIHPSKWAIFVGIIPIGGILAFLGLQLGSFMVFDPEARYQFAREKVALAKRNLPKLEHRSRQPVMVVILVNVGILALMATALAWPIGSLIDFASQLGIYLLASLILVAGLGFAERDSLLGDAGSSRIFRWVFSGLTMAFFLSAASVRLAVFWGDLQEMRGGLALILISVGALASILAPRSNSTWIRDWSVKGAAARSAAASLSRSYTSGRREMRDLQRLIRTEGHGASNRRRQFGPGAFGDRPQAMRCQPSGLESSH